MVAGEVAVFHLFEFIFPFAGEFRGGEGVDVHFPEEVDEAHAFAGDDEVAFIADDIFLGDEAFDGG